MSDKPSEPTPRHRRAEELELHPAEEAPVQEAPEEPGPAPQNLELERLPHESDAEFLARSKTFVPDSQSPADIVPNRPNIVMGGSQPAPPAEEQEA